MAVDAVQELHGLADVVHVRGHFHERETGRAEERLGVLEAAKLTPVQRARETHKQKLSGCSSRQLKQSLTKIIS